MRYFVYASAASLVLYATSTATAQDANPSTLRPTDVADEPQAGFGTEHLGSASQRQQARQTRDQQMPTWNPYTPRERPWFLNEGVRQELGFQEQQVEPLYNDYQAVWQRHQQRQATLEAGKSAEEQQIEQQAELARTLRTEFDTDLNQTTGRYFSEPQRQRLDQLSFQYGGVNSLTSPGYVEHFNFDDQQQRRISQLQDDYNRRMSELSQFQGSADERRQAFQDLQRQTAGDLDRVLNNQQRQTLQRMQGNQYQFSDSDYFGTAGDLDTRGRRGRQAAGTSQSGSPGTGVGLSGRRSPGSGVGLPQPNQPGAGTGNTDSGAGGTPSGAAGTAGDLDGQGQGGAASGAASGAGGAGSGAASGGAGAGSGAASGGAGAGSGAAGGTGGSGSGAAGGTGGGASGGAGGSGGSGGGGGSGSN